MKKIILMFIFISFFLSTNTSNAQEWDKLREMLVNQRDKVISACEEGGVSKGYSYKKIQNYCKCSVDYMTEIVTKYNKNQLNNKVKEKGGDFIEKEALQKCEYILE